MTNAQGDIFVGTSSQFVTNGVFRSKDDGQSWDMILNTANLGIGQMEINSLGHIYVSTGGFEPFRVSTDNGETWQSLTVPFNSVSKILCIGSDTLLLGTSLNNGSMLLRSPDRGINWDTLFISNGPASEFISDIAVSPAGAIYISLMAFMLDGGGIYKSVDNGNSWQYAGLFDCQIRDLAFNKSGDLFIGLFGSFSPIESTILAIYHDNPEIIANCPIDCSINGLVVNSSEDIYAGCDAWQAGLTRSHDNGLSFEFVNSDYTGPLILMSIDKLDYIYAVTEGGDLNILFKSVNSTYTAIFDPDNEPVNNRLAINPNPVCNHLGISLSSNVTFSSEINISIFDCLGKLIKSDKVLTTSGKIDMDVSFLKSGMYVLTIVNRELLFTSSFIKK